MRPRPAFPSSRRRGGFTLVELLVVVAIMGLLAAVAVPAFRGLNGAGKFNQAVSGVAGILEQAHAYAIAQNTYAWVVFYECDGARLTPPDASGHQLYVASFASNDGIDPFNWSGAVTLPGGTVGTTTFTGLTRLSNFKQIHLLLANGGTAAIPSAPAASYALAPAPAFATAVKTGTGTVALSSSGTVIVGYGVVQFTPSGGAGDAAQPVDAIWLGLQPMKSGALYDTNNVAGLKINGLTGLTTVYRN